MLVSSHPISSERGEKRDTVWFGRETGYVGERGEKQKDLENQSSEKNLTSGLESETKMM